MTDFLGQAITARQDGDAMTAYQYLVAAVVERPTSEAWYMLGSSLHELKRYGAAAAAFARCDRGNYRALVNGGYNLHLTGRSEEAEPLLREGVRLSEGKGDALPLTNLSQCLLRLGGYEEAVGLSERAVGSALDPSHEVALALAYFCAGRWEDGFRAYEARIPYKSHSMLLYPMPRWAGGWSETLLVQAEMGLGDTVQMMRFMPEVVRRVGRVVWYVHKELVGLARAFMPGVEVVGMPTSLPDVETWVPMMSLPRALGMVEPDGRAYLGGVDVPAVSRTVGFEEEVAQPLRVGIAWSGDPGNEESRWKDIPLAEFLPLIELSGIEWHALQVGRQDIGELGLWGLVQDRSREINDMADTARIVAGLDLVICSDSVLAHLAGAMGKPVWLLRNAKAAPWIWPMAGERTPWYETMRVLTRGRAESWSDLFARVRDRLLVEVGPIELRGAA